MKIKHLIIGICCITGFAACAGNKNNAKNEAMVNSGADSTYPVTVVFGSMCCGTVSSDFLAKFLKNFNANTAVKVTADIAEGCGKEGEFFVLFKIDEKQKASFTEKLIIVVNAEETSNRKKDPSSGGVEIRYNVSKTDLEYCRLGIKPWKP